jgi:hypothetical protein
MDEKILSVYVVFGFLVILGYIIMIYKNWGSKLGTAMLWSNKGRNIILEKPILNYLYKTMIALSFVSGIYLVYYLTTFQKDDTVQKLVYIGSVIFLLYSLIWAYDPFNYYIKLSLGLVAIGSLLILSGISLNVSQGNKGPTDIVALVAITVLVIQSGLFDFLIWNGFKPFFNNKRRS